MEAFFLESNEVDISALEHHGGHKPFQFELLIPALVMLKARALRAGAMQVLPSATTTKPYLDVKRKNALQPSKSVWSIAPKSKVLLLKKKSTNLC